MFVHLWKPLCGGAIVWVATAFGACADEPAPASSPEQSAAAPLLDQQIMKARVKAHCEPDDAGLTLPDGFCAQIVADGVGRARHLTVSPLGDVYVAIDGVDAPGGILALQDRNRDGRPEVQQYFGKRGANAVAVTDRHLYVSYRDSIMRYTKAPGELVPKSQPVTVVGGLPSTPDHNAKNFQLTDHGQMYVNIGSASNSCQVENRELESPGVDPCPELPTRAGIWRFSADREGQTQGDGTRFATGLRNIEALRWDADRDALYGLQHGRDHLNDNWPDLYSVEDGAELPSEELLRIDAGDDNGWPYCYHDWRKDLKVLAPEYGGDGTVVGRCEGMEEPIEVFPGHWAPNDLLFYSGEMFPAKYRLGIFIAFHGGHDRDAPLPNEGFNVVFLPLIQDDEGNDRPGAAEVFADGFTGGGEPLPQNAAHRPMGLAQSPDGSLYVSDDAGGRIYRIVYLK